MAGPLGILVLLAILLPGSQPPASLGAHTLSAPPQALGQAAQPDRVRSGLQHFERAFYDLTPKGLDADAARELEQAIADFEAELTARPASATAHAYLGRIYSLRKDYKKAAAHFDRLAELEPRNVDACVFAALALAEDGQTAGARSRLEMARRRTADPVALARLAEYLSKLDAVKR